MAEKYNGLSEIGYVVSRKRMENDSKILGYDTIFFVDIR